MLPTTGVITALISISLDEVTNSGDIVILSIVGAFGLTECSPSPSISSFGNSAHSLIVNTGLPFTKAFFLRKVISLIISWLFSGSPTISTRSPLRNSPTASFPLKWTGELYSNTVSGDKYNVCPLAANTITSPGEIIPIEPQSLKTAYVKSPFPSLFLARE